MYVAGVDSGSSATKLVILGDNDEILSYVVASTKPDIGALANELLHRALDETGLREGD